MEPEFLLETILIKASLREEVKRCPKSNLIKSFYEMTGKDKGLRNLKYINTCHIGDTCGKNNKKDTIRQCKIKKWQLLTIVN